ncbi:WhiB family transcriptional regulator [Streptomyces sp. NPDC091385]|uniref:WhiB family transcriptional regulator n=1 Tax=Streptomyces sp. NPDC091385 TaxID=3365997 RepID=UPI0037F36E47
MTESLSLPELFTRDTNTVNGGHLLWTGTRGPDAVPVIEFEGGIISAHDAAFRIEHGRSPAGAAAATCRFDWCVEPEHQGETGGTNGDGGGGGAPVGHGPRRPVPDRPPAAAARPAPRPVPPAPARRTIPVRDPEVPWQEQSACAEDGAPSPDVFLATTRTRKTEAVRFCIARCPVRKECLEDALRTEATADKHTPRLGVRGGHTDGDRRRIAARRREEAAARNSAASSA